MPILRDNTTEIISRTAEQTLWVGVVLGRLLTIGDVLCLHGPLGAGKTTLARGIGQGWGSSTRLSSPTYTLVNIHQRAKDQTRLYHIDAYRLEKPADLENVGFEDVFDGQGVVIIEWPQRLKTILPADHLWLTLQMDSSTASEEAHDTARRVLTLTAYGSRHQELLNAVRHDLFGV